MINALLSAIAAGIVQVISTAGYAGVTALMAIEAACVPLPSEVILPFAGYLVSTGRFSLFWVSTFGALGCDMGSTVAYFAAAKGGEALVMRWGSVLLISPKEIEHTRRFFVRYGAATVFVGRLLPVVRTFIAVPAGLARMSQWTFQLYTFAGSWLWCLALAYVGMKLGAKWDSDPVLRSWFHRFDVVILLAIVIATSWIVRRWIVARSR